jgi:large subunit ribosomal protein L15
LSQRFLRPLTLLSNSRTYAPLPLSRLQQYLASGRLDPTLPIGIGEIVRSNLIHGISGFSGVKLLGELDTSLPLPPLELNLSRFSKSAASAVIEAGGKVTAVYHNRLGLRQEVWPEKFVGREVEAARPIRKSDIRESEHTHTHAPTRSLKSIEEPSLRGTIEYYTNPKKHGYLAQATGDSASDSASVGSPQS